MRFTKLFLALSLLILFGLSLNSFAGQPRSITGSATAEEEGIKFRATVYAYIDADGIPSDIVLTDVDLTAIGLGKNTI